MLSVPTSGFISCIARSEADLVDCTPRNLRRSARRFSHEVPAFAARKLAITDFGNEQSRSPVARSESPEHWPIEHQHLGLEMAERYGFSIYDGLIVAAAVRAGCAILYTEDLQQGQVIDQLTI